MKLGIAALIVALLFTACSSSEKSDLNTAEGLFQRGERFEKNERFDEAVAEFATVKNKHPYSKFAVMAELKIADIHFKREYYPEAQNAYQLFKELHPKHEKIAYVTQQLGLSYFHQLPESIDRDLALADKAIIYFDEVINSYATSEFVPAAKEHRRKAMRMLAEKELYVAKFYFIREKYDSALGRYQDLLKNYPNTGVEPQALYGAAVSAHRLKDDEKAKVYFERLTSLFPKSDEAAKARSEFE